MPIIKANITSYAIEEGSINFKIIVFKDNYSLKKVKKTYNDFYELD